MRGIAHSTTDLDGHRDSCEKGVMELNALRQAAIARRDAALAEAKRWDDFLRMLDEATRGLSVMGGGTISVKFPETAMGSASWQRSEIRDVGRMTETEMAARAIIQENGGNPVSTQAMLVELEKRGVGVGGKDPISTLSARLSRAPSLENVRPHGWRLREPSLTNEAAVPVYNSGTAASGSTSTAKVEGPMPTPAPPVEPGGGGGT